MSVQEHPAFTEEQRTLTATLLRVDQEDAFLTVRNKELLIKRIVDTPISAAIYGDSTGIPTDEFLLFSLGSAI